MIEQPERKEPLSAPEEVPHEGAGDVGAGAASGMALLRQLREVSVLGFVVVGAGAMGFVAGILLNRWFGTGAGGIGLGVLAGTVLGLYWASRRVGAMLRRMARQAKARARDEAGSGKDL